MACLRPRLLPAILPVWALHPSWSPVLQRPGLAEWAQFLETQVLPWTAGWLSLHSHGWGLCPLPRRPSWPPDVLLGHVPESASAWTGLRFTDSSPGTGPWGRTHFPGLSSPSADSSTRRGSTCRWLSPSSWDPSVLLGASCPLLTPSRATFPLGLVPSHLSSSPGDGGGLEVSLLCVPQTQQLAQSLQEVPQGIRVLGGASVQGSCGGR